MKIINTFILLIALITLGSCSKAENEKELKAEVADVHLRLIEQRVKDHYKYKRHYPSSLKELSNYLGYDVSLDPWKKEVNYIIKDKVILIFTTNPDTGEKMEIKIQKKK